MSFAHLPEPQRRVEKNRMFFDPPSILNEAKASFARMLMRAREEACFFEPTFAPLRGGRYRSMSFAHFHLRPAARGSVGDENSFSSLPRPAGLGI